MTVAELDPRVQDIVGKTGKLLIDGNWVEAVSGKTFETFDPATEQSLGSVAHGEAADVDLAVAAARRCFDDDKSDWRRMTPSERGRIIHRIGDLPWSVTFSYGRALQAAPQKAWSGKPENVAAAQRAFTHRARMNSLATKGEWSADLEKERKAA